MQVKITSEAGYRCAPNGSIVEFYPCGAIVSGKVAELAIRNRAGVVMADPREEFKPDAPTEYKRRGRPRKDGL